MESRYWKKFQTVALDKQGDSGGMLRSALSFCPSSNGEKPNLLATAVSARVDIYKLTQPSQEDEEDESEGLKPIQRIFKFKDIATAVEMRQDGNIVVCGEKTGRVQIIELGNKFILKTYEEHQNQINGFHFRENMKEFIAAANDTNLKLFNILEQQSVLTIHNAHSDNVKKVQYLRDDLVLSGSSDRTLKLWDLRISSEPLSSIKLHYPIEDFCKLNENKLIVANGSSMTLISTESNLKLLTEYQAFQKPVMRVRWDSHRERLMAGGQDGQLKLFAMEEDSLKVAYKIKLPEEVACMDMAIDGNHFAVGLASGALVIKSKRLEAEEKEETQEQKLVKNALQSSFVSKAKNYKYFYRGQYSVITPDQDTITPDSLAKKKSQLQPYEQCLKRFQYREALNLCLKANNPEVTLALFEELVERGSLELALSQRSPAEFRSLLGFIRWKITDHRYQTLLIEVARVLIDMYQAPILNINEPEVEKAIKDITQVIEREVQVEKELKQIGGQLEMMFRMASSVAIINH